MSGAFFFEYIVTSLINLEVGKAKKTDSKVSKVQSVKNPKKK